MQLIDLPEEILIMIVRELDMCSLKNLYNTCKWTRNIVRMYRVIKCILCRSVLATANSLKLNIFKDISEHLLELNMCGVPDLCKTVFIPAVKSLKNLKILDVSYTNLNILDLLEIHKTCPSLKDITINFLFGKLSKLSNNVLLQCQSLFENFEKVHFIGSLCSLLNSKLGYFLLTKASLHNLKYTLAESCCTYQNVIDEDSLPEVKLPQFNEYFIYFLDWKYKRNQHSDRVYSMKEIPMLAKLELELQNYEYIIIHKEGFISVIFASDIFYIFLKEKFRVDSTSIPQSGVPIYGNIVFMLWHKDSVNFNEYFYYRLQCHIEKYFPHYINFESNLNMLPRNHNWFYSNAIPNATDKQIVCSAKKRRVALHNSVLDYDVIFENKHRVELTLIFLSLTTNIALSRDSSYLRKLTFLSLAGFPRYSSDFFNILFKNCECLATLNVESSPVSPCLLAISRSLPLSKSLKNIRLLEKIIDFKILFLSFSKCLTLENIHIVDKSCSNNNLADPSVLLEKCFRLYSIYIEASMTGTAYTKIMRQFKKAKDVNNRPYVNFMIQKDDKLVYKYDPFVEVFKLNPIKPV